MDAINQIIKGKRGAPDIMMGELALKWELGAIRKNDLEPHYGMTEEQIFEFSKAVKEKNKKGPPAMAKCSNCDEAIDDVSFKEGICGKCGKELRYGLEGCGG